MTRFSWFRWVLWLALLLSAACATVGQTPNAAPATDRESLTPELEARILYHLSQGYLAMQDGNIPLAYEHFSELEALGYVNPEVLRLKASILIHGGAIEQALAELDRALAVAPDDLETLVLKGGVLAALGRREEAITTYKHVLKLRPDHETAAVFIAGLYEEAGQEKKARRTLEMFLKKNPDAGLALFELGRLQLAARNWREAKSLFIKSIALSPENVRAWIGLGFACEGLGDRPGAIDAYQNAIKLDPSDRAIRRQLIHLHLRANDPDAAMEETKGLEILGGAAETRVTRGIVLYHQGKTSEALAEFNLVLERDPKNQQARFLAGASLARLNHNAEAIAAYQRIPPDSGYHFDARLNLATVLMRLGRHGDALAELDLLEKDDPNDLDLLRIRGAVLSAMGRNEQAETTLQRALKLKPNDPEILYALAILYEKTDRWKQAIELMEKRLTEEPNDVDALNFIGYTLADRNYDLPRAEKMLAHAIQLKPYSGHIIDSHGWVLYKLGQFEQALPALLRAFELEPSEAVIADHIGDTYAKLGQAEKAREFWRQALALNPEPPLAAQLKEKLGEK